MQEIQAESASALADTGLAADQVHFIPLAKLDEGCQSAHAPYRLPLATDESA